MTKELEQIRDELLDKCWTQSDRDLVKIGFDRASEVTHDHYKDLLNQHNEEIENLRSHLLSQCKTTQQLLDEKFELQKQLDEAIEILKFYSYEDNWYNCNIGTEFPPAYISFTSTDAESEKMLCGKKAREYLKKVGIE